MASANKIDHDICEEASSMKEILLLLMIYDKTKITKGTITAIRDGSSLCKPSRIMSMTLN